MDERNFSRRRLLRRFGGLGLAISLSGCNETGCDLSNGLCGETPRPLDSNPSPQPTPGTEPGGRVTQHPDTPPAIFESPSGTYSFYDLTQYEREPSATLEQNPGPMRHPDNRIFNLEINGNEATATLEGVRLQRDIQFTLKVRDVNHRFQTATATLEAPSTQSSETTTPESLPSPNTYTVPFDLSGINLPTGAGSYAELTATDVHPNAPESRFIKSHQFVGIDHDYGTHWVNAGSLNPIRHTNGNTPLTGRPQGIWKNGDWLDRTADPPGYVHTIDKNNERVVLLAVRTPQNYELFGVSCHISHEPYDRYLNGSNAYQIQHAAGYECKYADKISHLKELSRKAASAITESGLTGEYARIEALGDLVQMIPYGSGHIQDQPPTVTLYDVIGDCTHKSALYAALLQNDSWDIHSAFIRCKVRGTAHRTPGIDIRDLGGITDTDGMFLVPPTDEQLEEGFPDTQYAFFDMTYDAHIGQVSDGIENVHLYTLDDYSTRDEYIAEDEPDY